MRSDSRSENNDASLTRASPRSPSPPSHLPVGEELTLAFRKNGLYNIDANTFNPGHMPEAKTVGEFLVGAAAFYKKKQVRISSAMND